MAPPVFRVIHKTSTPMPEWSHTDLSVHFGDDMGPEYVPDYGLELDDSYTREIMHNNYGNVLIDPYNNIFDNSKFLSTQIDTRPSIPVLQCDTPPENQTSSSLLIPAPEYSRQQPLYKNLNLSYPSQDATCSYIPPPSLQLETAVPLCTVCEGECTSAHSCPGCHIPFHTI